jgi:hypothetical protein
MSPVRPVAAGLAALAMLPACAVGQEPKTPDPSARIAELEKRVAKVEAELEAARKQLADPKRRPETAIQLVSLGRIEASVAIKVLRVAYGDRPRFKVVHLNEYNALVIRADERTLEQAIQMVRQLQPLHDQKKK